MNKFFLTIVSILLLNTAQAQIKGMEAKLTVKAITTTTNFDQDGKVSGKILSEISYETGQFLTYDPGIFATPKSRISYCSDLNATCNFIRGSTTFGEDNSSSLKVLVKYTFKTTNWSICNDQLKETHKREGEGSLSDYTVMTQIGFVKNFPVSQNFQPVPLIKSADDFVPAPLVKGEYTIRLYVTVGGLSRNLNPNAPKQTEQYRDCFMDNWVNLESVSLIVQNISELSSNVISRNTADHLYFFRYTPITENEVKALLKDTGGEYVPSRKLNLTYYSYSKNADNGKVTDESETKIFVTYAVH
ncbi:hypothetical protein BH09BAC2_BH09BAC2_13600 [soil metagenome]